MLKCTVLLALLTGACAMDPATSSIESQTGTDGDECNEKCTIDGVEVDLEELNFPGDREVTFCHATGSETNPYVLITTNVNGCNGHANENHEPGGNVDIFPEAGCVD